MSREARHHDRAVVLGALAVVRLEQGRPGEAERLLEECLQALDGAEDETPPVSVVLGFDRLGFAAWSRGETQRAEQLYRRVARLSEAAYGPTHPEHALALVNLGTVLQQAGQPGTAEYLYRRALDVLENSVKQDDGRGHERQHRRLRPGGEPRALQADRDARGMRPRVPQEPLA